MKIKDFLTEKWMNDYERQARYNLTDTSCDALSMEDLLAFQPDALANLPLDYGWITGDPALRQEILSLYSNTNPATLTMTCGALQANEMAMAMLLHPEDHVISFTPSYQQFAEFPQWFGCSVSVVPYQIQDWSLDFEKVKAALKENTKLIVFANPSNPTGTWLDARQIAKLVAIAKDHSAKTGKPLWILCDEVYRDPLDEKQPAISDCYEYGISTGSFSKLFGLAGLRLGWVKANPKLIQEIDTFRDYSIISAGPLAEKLGLIALQHKEQILEKTHQTVAQNLAVIQDWLKKTPYFSCVLPSHGTVAFLKIPEGISSEAFAKDLLAQTGIFFVPGSCFGLEGYVRLGLGKTHADLAGVLDKLDAWTENWLAQMKSEVPMPKPANGSQ